MRLIIIPILYILAISCSSEQVTKNEELNVIAAIYKRTPKILPPPPPPLPNSEVKEENNIDYSKLKPLMFTYAINDHFVYYNFDYVNEVSNRFHPAKSKELFEKKVLDSTYMKLVVGLSVFQKKKKIDKPKLIKILNEDLIFWNKQTISIEEKRKTNISGIISFSRVSFNDNFTKAAVASGSYFERIGSGVSLYILEKIGNEWVVKYSKVLEMS